VNFLHVCCNHSMSNSVAHSDAWCISTVCSNFFDNFFRFIGRRFKDCCLLSVTVWTRHLKTEPPAGPGSYRIGPICFLAGWRKRRPEPGFSSVRFSFVCVSSFLVIVVWFLCCNVVIVTFVLLVPANWLARKAGFCTSQVIGCEDCFWNDLSCVECDIMLCYTI